MTYWIVVEWNQASGQPRIVGDDLHWTEDEAEAVAERERAQTRAVGRREQFTVHEIEVQR
ncbi:hypothetical protein [Microbacterium sp. cx-59]|uniref:hypothetical protein n=1 Tax=Microbacterium sp. cx-59 TaxID=2891207 RepID=UPI001E4F2646|nr:hypothetical protein [Microbacterium sp. cx-59]MCC4906944.1 hypothetical protein [Microbacterium sp. cx-59]